MSVLVVERPGPGGAATARSSRAARRAVGRWALRLFRRDWRQQVLVLALATVAVAAAVAGSTIITNLAPTYEGRFGSAGAAVRIDNANPAQASTDLAAARLRFGTVDVIAHSTAPVPGAVDRLDVRDQNPAGPYSAPMLKLRSGRYPARDSEVALTKSAAALLGATVGAATALGRASVTVVGIVENPSELRDNFALVAPGTLTAPDRYEVLVRTDGGVEGGPGVPNARLIIEGASSARDDVEVVALVAATLALALVGLVAAAGFVVVAQRRQRQLGLLAAIGGTGAQVRTVMVANGALVGLVAAVVGGGLGLAGWLVSAGPVESAANHRIDRLDLPWALVIAIVIMGLVMSVGAAWWPARAAARLPVMAALSGRPAPPRPVHRSLLVAGGLVAAGVAAIYAANPRRPHVQPLLLVAGLLAVVLGAVFAAPAAVRALGGLARRLPLAPRLALRDLARYQARAAAALAAITLGLAVAVGVLVVATASAPYASEGNLSSSELVVHLGPTPKGPEPTVAELDADEVAQFDQQAQVVVAALGPGVHGVPLDSAVMPTDRGAGVRRVELGLTRSAHETEFLGNPYVATPEVLRAYHIDPASIDPAADLLINEDAPYVLGDPAQYGRSTPPAVKVQHVTLPPWEGAPHALVTEAALARHGWTAMRAGWIAEAPHALTASQITAARAAAAKVGRAVEVRDARDDAGPVRTGATAVGALVALAIVAMAVGLIRGESARDVRTLTATGAAPHTRRALTATTAAALALVGALLGTAAAYVALLAAYRGDLVELGRLPVAHLLVLVVGVPVVAAFAGWALAGREPTTYARQALD